MSINSAVGEKGGGMRDLEPDGFPRDVWVQ